jgi:hypothetical protein
MTPAASNLKRWPAVTLLAMAAVLPAGILFMYLFTGEPADWRHRLVFAIEPGSAVRVRFILLPVGAAVSTIAACAIALSKHRLVLRGAFAGAAALALAYAAMGMWLFLLVSVLPLWWAYKVAA